MKSILDPSFRYTPSINTDIRKTFARIRRDLRAESERAIKPPTGSRGNVSSIVGKSNVR
jgi:hypothetical protein